MLMSGHRTTLCGAMLVATAAWVATACSSGGQPTSSPAEPNTPTTATASPAPGEVRVSPGGVTTEVAVPADATESEYGQACHAAKVWMDMRQGDARTLVEPYLELLQAPDAAGPGTFGRTWTALTPAQQAAVIMAVNGAADGDCF